MSGIGRDDLAIISKQTIGKPSPVTHYVTPHLRGAHARKTTLCGFEIGTTAGGWQWATSDVVDCRSCLRSERIGNWRKGLI